MNIEEWRQFLKRYNIELSQAEDFLLTEVPDEAISYYIEPPQLHRVQLDV